MIAIIIPTYNRPAMLAKALLFLRACGVDCPIHVADGSGQEAADRNARAIARASRHLELTHHPQPPEVPMYQRIALVAEGIKARYILLHADDDYLFLDAVRDCVTFLESHPMHVCCQGPMVSYFLSKPDPERLKPYLTNPYEEATALDRVKGMIYQYSPTFYAVHRRSVLVEAFGGGKFRQTSPRMDEIMSALHTVALGRVGQIDRLYGLRLVHSDQASQDDTWMDLMIQEDFSAQWTSKMEAVVDAVARTDKRDVRETRRLLRRAFLYYLRNETRGKVNPSATIINSRSKHAALVASTIDQTNVEPSLSCALEMI